MERSQVEYNRKHGRGRGGKGRGNNNSNNNSAAAVPRHLRPTASSKAKTAQDSSRANEGASSPIPSYLAPTSSSVGKTKPASPKSSGRRSGWRQSASSPTSSDEQRKRPGRTQQASPSQSPSAAQRATISTTTASITAAVMLPALSTTTRQEQLLDKVRAIPKRTPQQPPSSSRLSSRKDPPADPLPDSPEQRVSLAKEEQYAHVVPPPPPSSQSALLLYHSHSHVMYPKPHETPILQLDLDPDVLAKALEMSVPWYQRLRLHTYVALAIDPEREPAGAHDKPGQAARTPPTRTTETNNVPGDENDAAVDALLLEHTDTLVELESLNTSSNVGEKPPNAESSKQYSSSKSATSESAASATSGAESKLLQRARRYKQQQQQGNKPRSNGTSQDPVAPRKSPLPDPPAQHGVYAQNQQPQQQQQQHPHDWEIPPAMSDLTMPTALHSDPPKSRPLAATGVSVITRVLPTEEPPDEEDEMDQWLDSALQSHDDADDADMSMDHKPAAAPRQDDGKESTNTHHHQEPAINLEAFAEDEEENMEDWLDSQIS